MLNKRPYVHFVWYLSYVRQSNSFVENMIDIIKIAIDIEVYISINFYTHGDI